jgi:hypothetical protein
MSRPVAITKANGIVVPEMHLVDCCGEGCQFWISIYSAEGFKQSPECALVLPALSNADGLFVV